MTKVANPMNTWERMTTIITNKDINIIVKIITSGHPVVQPNILPAGVVIDNISTGDLYQY